MSFIKKNKVALLLIVISGALIAVGVWRTEPQTVLRKAVNICMECIGLG